MFIKKYIGIKVSLARTWYTKDTQSESPRYVTFIINVVFSFIIYLILVNIFLKMLHLPNGYEILQACT
jgi:uncharacterized protein with PQ loop repeat